MLIRNRDCSSLHSVMSLQFSYFLKTCIHMGGIKKQVINYSIYHGNYLLPKFYVLMHFFPLCISLSFFLSVTLEAALASNKAPNRPSRLSLSHFFRPLILRPNNISSITALVWWSLTQEQYFICCLVTDKMLTNISEAL